VIKFRDDTIHRGIEPDDDQGAFEDPLIAMVLNLKLLFDRSVADRVVQRRVVPVIPRAMPTSLASGQRSAAEFGGVESA